MKYYDQNFGVDCLIDVIAFNKAIDGQNIITNKSNTNGVVVCSNNLEVINARKLAKLVDKQTFEYGCNVAKKIGKPLLTRSAKFQLKDLTESEEKTVDIKYGVVTINNQDKVAIQFVNYMATKLFIPHVEKLYLPIFDRVREPITGEVVFEFEAHKIHIDDIVLGHIETGYLITKDDYLFLYPNEFVSRVEADETFKQRIFDPKGSVEIEYENDETYKSLFSRIEHSHNHYFITGAAGTGKSTFLRYLSTKTQKTSVTLAFTGTAALNAKGQTIHSFFKLPLGIIDPKKFIPRRNRIFEDLDLLIIDEISMVRADILDAIDITLKKNKKNTLPFGGVQLVLFGDLYQLSPVKPFNKDSDAFFSEYYRSAWFFDSMVYSNIGSDFQVVELTDYHRQQDRHFIELLNAIRNGTIDEEKLKTLNSNIASNINPIKDMSAINLCTTNMIVDQINADRLRQIDSRQYAYEGQVRGQFDRKAFPADPLLNLKVGAQVMFTKNDYKNRWVNGSIATIDYLSDNCIKVKINDQKHVVEKATWENYQYKYDRKSKSIQKFTVGEFSQYPLKLAWAITIHKSQGKTFDSIILNMGTGAFTHGQTYVALSRCRSLDGIILSKEITSRDIIIDSRVKNYLSNSNNL